jgi:hypothetical protein
MVSFQTNFALADKLTIRRQVNQLAQAGRMACGHYLILFGEGMRDAIEAWDFTHSALAAEYVRNRVIWDGSNYVLSGPNNYAGFPQLRVITFPVKHNWWEKANLELIRQSAMYLATGSHASRYETIYMPKVECEACFASCIGECLDATMVLSAVAIKDDSSDLEILGLLGDLFTDLHSFSHVLALGGRSGGKSLASHVIDELNGDAREGTCDGEAWACSIANDFGADATLSALPELVLGWLHSE